jgi:arylformamidase
MAPPRRVHDLTARLETHMPVWATEPLPVFEPIAFVARDGYLLERIASTSHTGTHMDAPSHFIEDGMTVDEIPPERLVGLACMLDVGGEAEGPVVPVRALERHWPTDFRPEIVLLRTGWSAERAPTKRYLYEFPGIDPAGAEWLAGRGVKGVGTDALGIDPYTNAKFEAHKVLLGRGIWILEALDHLDQLVEGRPYTLVAGPIKIAHGSGGMARVLAWEE